MNIKVIAGTQETKTGFKLYEFGSVIPDKINKSLIQSMYSEDGTLTVDAGIDLGETIELTGANGSVTLVKGDGSTVYTGESDAPISYYNDVSFEIGAGVAPIKKPSDFADPTIGDITQSGFTVVWTPPTSGDTVESYTMVVKSHGTEIAGSPFTFGVDDTTKVLDGLEADKDFGITMTATNSAGSVETNAVPTHTLADTIEPSANIKPATKKTRKTKTKK